MADDLVKRLRSLADAGSMVGVASNWPLEAIEMKYQHLAKRAHPDSGGTQEAMAALNQAIEAARKELTA